MSQGAAGQVLSTPLVSSVFSDVSPWATTVFLLSLRIATVLGMTPILYAVPMPARVRALLVVSLSLILAAAFSGKAEIHYSNVGRLIEAALLEVSLGLTFSIGILLAFAAFSMAGNLIDIQIGFGIAQVYDPLSNRPSAILISSFNYLGLLVFFLIDGHHALLRALAYSVDVFPLGQVWSASIASTGILKQVAGMFGLGFGIAAPIVFCIFLVELALGVISRNLPQINMLVIGVPVKIVAGLIVLSLWLVGMGPSMNRVYASIFHAWAEIMQN